MNCAPSESDVRAYFNEHFAPANVIESAVAINILLLRSNTGEPIFLFQLLEPPREKTAIRFLRRQSERLLIRSTGLGNSS